MSGYATVFHKILKRFNDFGTLENIDYDFKSKEEISKDDTLKKYFSISAMGIEGLFMEWIVRALKPGKKAFIVIPDGIMNRSNDKKLRDFILEQCNIDAVISLPLNTFFTTNKKTYILALTKKVAVNVGGVATLPKQMTPVFTYLCSEIGETRDVYRFDIDQNDLEVASDLFNMFKGAKSKFRTDDKRCKIVDIEDFYNGTHWSVDRWWTRDEKIALGIEDNIETVSLEDYIGMVSDTASTLMEFDEPLRELVKKKSAIVSSIEVSLNDKTLFDLSIGKRLLRKDYIEASGGIPAYSSNVFSPFVYTSYSNVVDFSVPYVLWGIDGTFDYDGKYMTWSTNGFAGTILVLDGKFSINGDRGVLIPKDGRTDIDLDYMKFTLEPLFRDLAKGRKGDNGEDEFTKLYPSMLNDIMIPVPVDEHGSIDLCAQKEIATKYLAIERSKDEVVSKLDALIQQKIEL